MTYNLTITRSEPNPQYKPKDPDYGYSDRRSLDERDPFILTALQVELTQEQFDLIRKTVMEKWQ